MEQQAKAPADIRNVATFLRSSSSAPRTRVGALNGKRIDYFKGKSAIKALSSPAYAATKNMPRIASEADAMALLSGLNAFAFFIRVQRDPTPTVGSAPRAFTLVPEQAFLPDEYYAWFFHGSQWRVYAGGALMVAIMLAGVMFPLWPPILRLGVWYLSIGMLGLIGLFFVLAIVRLIFYIITVLVTSPGIWIFPKLFADVGFIDSFIPLWEWDLPKKKTKRRRGDKGKEKATSENPSEVDSAYIEEVAENPPSEKAQGQNRSAHVEEVNEDDD